MFVVFTVELDSPESARARVEISKQTKRSDTATLGFGKDNVFSLLVVRSVIQGEESIEKDDSLERFSEPIGVAMKAMKKVDARKGYGERHLDCHPGAQIAASRRRDATTRPPDSAPPISVGSRPGLRTPETKALLPRATPSVCPLV